MSSKPEYRPETVAVHAGHIQTGDVQPVSAPLVLSSSFARNPSGELPGGFMYSRLGNPNRLALEQCLAQLESAGACAAFASGSAATTAVLQALAPGDHVLLSEDIYYGTRKLVHEIAEPWGVKASQVDTSDVAAVEAALQPNTRLIWLETPSNPLLRISDIFAISALAHERGILVAVDNTFATPLLQQPLALGADLVVHSTSKFLSGHSDVVGGAVIARDENSPLFQRLCSIQRFGGAVPSPFDCWLALRGVRTLAVRLRAQCENAQRIALYLAEHPEVQAVHYPGLPSHSSHALAIRQMKHGGPMLSFQLRGGKQKALLTAGRTRLFRWATSLGGVESLVEHRASVEQGTRVPDDLLRLSVGVEHGDDLIADLEQALEF